MASLLRLWLITILVSFNVPQVASQSFAETAVLPRIQLNDNHQAAGQLTGGVLQIALVAEEGLWYPAGENEPGIPIQAFREAAGQLEIPGPLIRVPAGTKVRASVRNALPGRKLTIHGLTSRPDAAGKESPVGPGETKEIEFVLDAPGTYFYWGTTTDSPLEKRYAEDSQLSGAIVVDAPGKKPEANEEIFVIGIWVNTVVPGPTRNALHTPRATRCAGAGSMRPSKLIPSTFTGFIFA